MNQEKVEKLKKIMQERLTNMAVFMSTGMGFPVEVFEEAAQYEVIKGEDGYLTIDFTKENSLLDQLAIINNFAKRHPKVIKPIYYTDI